MSARCFARRSCAISNCRNTDLQVIAYEGGAVFTRDGDYLASYRDHDSHRREFARYSTRDAEAYERYARDVTRQCRFIQPLLMRTAPDPFSFKPRDIVGTAVSRQEDSASSRPDDMAQTLRFWTMSISDFLDEYFETDVIKAYLALSGIIGTALGPMSPGTAYVLLHHYMGEVDGSVGAWGYARGGMGAVTPGACLLLPGIRRHDPHRRRCRQGDDPQRPGDRRRCLPMARRCVASSSSPMPTSSAPSSSWSMRRTCRKASSTGSSISRCAARPASSISRSTACRNFRPFRKAPPASRGDLHFTDSMERMERAYDDWKAGHWSADPFVDMMIPTTLDPTMAPPGKHFMSCFVQYCPPKVEGRGLDRRRPRRLRRYRRQPDRRLFARLP